LNNDFGKWRYVTTNNPAKIKDALWPASHYWLLVPATLRKRGQALLHRQCWCWGQDVRREEGNALLHLGFERTRPPRGSGASMYTLDINGQCCIALWGFGMGFWRKPRGGIFLGRFLFAPRYCETHEPPIGVHESKQLTDFAAPCSMRQCETAIELMCGALEWISDYETQVLQEFGLQYRVDTLKKWSHHSIPPAAAPQVWRDLSASCRQKIRIFHRNENGVHEVKRFPEQKLNGSSPITARQRYEKFNSTT